MPRLPLLVWAHALMGPILWLMPGLLLSLWCAASHAAQDCPQQVRISFLDYEVAPWFNGSGDGFPEPPGQVVAWIQQALAQTQCPTKVQLLRRPVKRFHLELEQGMTDILAMSSVTPERLAREAFPLKNGALDTRMAYLVSGTSLWVRKGDKSVQWDGRALRGPEGFKVGVSAGQGSEALAREHGWPVELALNGRKVIDKLLAGRSAVILLPDITVEAAAASQQAQMDRLLPSLEQTPFFSPANRGFQARYPVFMARYWQALCQVAHAGTAASRPKEAAAQWCVSP